MLILLLFLILLIRHKNNLLIILVSVTVILYYFGRWFRHRLHLLSVLFEVIRDRLETVLKIHFLVFIFLLLHQGRFHAHWGPFDTIILRYFSRRDFLGNSCSFILVSCLSLGHELIQTWLVVQVVWESSLLFGCRSVPLGLAHKNLHIRFLLVLLRRTILSWLRLWEFVCRFSLNDNLLILIILNRTGPRFSECLDGHILLIAPEVHYFWFCGLRTYLCIGEELTRSSLQIWLLLNHLLFRHCLCLNNNRIQAIL